MRMNLKVRSVNVAPALTKSAIARKRALVATVEAARMDTRPYVPRVSGDLAGTADSESKPEAGLLVYGNSAVPYARYQYYLETSNRTRDKHPQATSQWFQHSKADNKKKWERVMASVYQKEFGG